MRKPLALLLAPPLLAGCASLSSPPAGLVDGRLPPCPAAPHCVSSEAVDPPHAIAPLQLVAPGADAWRRLAETVASGERTTVIEQREGYLRAEVVSPWHVYTDDLELLWRPGQRRVDVRSSSRIGYYDFSVNRERVEALRARLVAAGLVDPG